MTRETLDWRGLPTGRISRDTLERLLARRHLARCETHCPGLYDGYEEDAYRFVRHHARTRVELLLWARCEGLVSPDAT